MIRKENKTFSASIFSDLNATVGPNGSDGPEGQARSNRDYALGYSTAAIALIDLAIESNDLRNSPDYLVYPICFSMRHSLELYLKKFWDDLKKLSEFRGVRLKNYRDEKCGIQGLSKGQLEPFPAFDTNKSHDVSILWEYICEYSPLIDSRICQYIEILDEFVRDIAEIDPSGQTFRYPENNESEMNLKETPLINIEILKIRFSFLSDILDSLQNFFQALIYEYQWVNVTANLSYFDLYEISMKLNCYKVDGIPCYVAAASDIKNEYGIKKSEYCRAIKLISSDRLLSQNVTDNARLVYLELADIIKYIEIYFETGSGNRPGTSDDYEPFIYEPPTIDELLKDIGRQSECVKKIYSCFDIEKLAELHALYYFAREMPYHNIYLSHIDSNLIELNNSVNGVDASSQISQIDFFFSKTNMVENLISSLWSLNFKKYAEEIINVFDLHERNFWIKIKSGETYFPFREIISFKNEISKAKSRLLVENDRVVSVMLSTHESNE